MLDFKVDHERCTRCDLCVKDCPARIIERADNAVPCIQDENAASCIRCQHCLAICPTAAISILGRNPDDSIPLDPTSFPDTKKMHTLLRGRRTVRQYKKENVDATLIKALIASVANAPTGVNARQLQFHVIEDRAVMATLREDTLTELQRLNEAGKVPDAFGYLKTAPGAYFEHGVDIIYRDAPHALIISAKPNAFCAEEDAVIALSYFELLAQTAGLGTVWWGMLKMMTAILPELRARLGVPKDHKYFYGMLFGKPAVTYARTVQRDEADIRTIAL